MIDDDLVNVRNIGQFFFSSCVEMKHVPVVNTYKLKYNSYFIILLLIYSHFIRKNNIKVKSLKLSRITKPIFSNAFCAKMMCILS